MLFALAGVTGFAIDAGILYLLMQTMGIYYTVRGSAQLCAQHTRSL